MKIENDDLLNENEIVDNKTTIDNSSELDDLLDGEGAVSLEKLKKNKKTQSNTFAYIVLFISILLFTISYGTYSYFNYVNKDFLTNSEKDYVNFVNENILKKIYGDDTTAFDSSISDPYIKADNMKKYISDRAVFIYDKNESIKKENKDFISKTKVSINNINASKEELIKYKYLPKDIYPLIKDVKILPILLSLNAIKLYITDYVYINSKLFDTDILSNVKNSTDYNSLSSYINSYTLDKYIKDDILSLRESGTKVYLSNLVFNYMYVKGTSTGRYIYEYYIDSFIKQNSDILSHRYNVIKQNVSNFNMKREDFYRTYVIVLTNVYENTYKLFDTDMKDTLPINIKLLSYDPDKQNLSFSIKLSTEANSPVDIIVLAKDVIQALRESRLIIGKNISVNKLDVNNSSIRISGEKIVYKTIDFKFSTSIQRKDNVEVTDSNK